MSAPTRLTRKEQQARTRQALIAAAATVFARSGFIGASVEEIAAEAGFTKGAVYANFSSKDELALAMLDESFARRAEVLKELEARDGSTVDIARAGALEFAEYVAGDRQWRILFFEFALHAARNEAFAQRLLERYTALVDQITHAVDQRIAPGAVSSSKGLGLMIFAMGNGIALQQLLDPKGTPESLFADMLELLTLGATTKDPTTDG